MSQSTKTSGADHGQVVRLARIEGAGIAATAILSDTRRSTFASDPSSGPGIDPASDLPAHSWGEATGGPYVLNPVPIGVAHASFNWPIDSQLINQGYWSGHHGIDINAFIGEPLVAAAPGLVTYAAWDATGYGNLVIINHADGFSSYYGHQSQIVVHTGQFVNRGELIGYAGSTGNSTGPHLHFEIRYHGVQLNPLAYLSGAQFNGPPDMVLHASDAASTIPVGLPNAAPSGGDSLYTAQFAISTGILQPRASRLLDTVEGSNRGWTTGGSDNVWAVTDATAHSGIRAWAANLEDSNQGTSDSWLQSPLLNLSGVTEVQVSAWYRYAVHTRAASVYLEYSLDGGTTWAGPLATFEGATDWISQTVDAPVLDYQPQVRLRYHLVGTIRRDSDTWADDIPVSTLRASVNDVHVDIDDIDVSGNPVIYPAPAVTSTVTATVTRATKATPTATPTVTPTAVTVAVAALNATPKPKPQPPKPQPTRTATAIRTPTPTSKPLPTSTPGSTATTASATPIPDSTPVPDNTPVPVPTSTPGATSQPTQVPTAQPTGAPPTSTPGATSQPTQIPTIQPTGVPPTNMPGVTSQPTQIPTAKPTSTPRP